MDVDEDGDVGEEEDTDKSTEDSGEVGEYVDDEEGLDEY